MIDRTGFEPAAISHFVVDGAETVNRSISRDWATIEGGAKLVSYSPPSYAGYGCGPRAAFDNSVGSGWSSDAPDSTAGSSVTGPRSIIVQLPKAVNVSSFGFAAGNDCGDPTDAAVSSFEIYTRKVGGRWVLAFTGGRLPIGRMIDLVPRAGKTQVRFVKLVMLANRGNDKYMDMRELSVRGT